MINRKPIASGKLYPSDFTKLDNQVKMCFLDKAGPGDFPTSRKSKKIIGVICPNSSYDKSGPISAWSFKELAECEFPQTYIILSTNNSNFGNDISTYTFTDWETPFGIINVNKGIALKLTRKFKNIINELEPFSENNTIEVQLPLLQYASKDNLKNLNFVPIIIKTIDYNYLLELAKAITSIKNEIYFNIIISSNIIGDNTATDYIKDLNSKSYYDYLVKNNLLSNEASPLIVGLECAKLMGAKRARLLNIKSCGKDITYGAFVFE